jgi:hypothetical protein
MYKEGSTANAIKRVGERLYKLSLLHLKDFNSSLLEGKSAYDVLNILFIKQKSTYTLHENGRMQCGKDAKRSAGDMYRIMKYYYPTITFPEFRQLLLDLINGRKLNSLYCNTIYKRVFFKYGFWNNAIGCMNWLDTRDEFRLKFEKE